MIWGIAFIGQLLVATNRFSHPYGNIGERLEFRRINQYTLNNTLRRFNSSDRLVVVRRMSRVGTLFSELTKRIVQGDNNNGENVEEILVLLQSLTELIVDDKASVRNNSIMLPTSMIPSFIKTLDGAQKLFRANKRSASKDNTSTAKSWEDALRMTKQLGRTLIEIEQQRKKAVGTASCSDANDDDNKKAKATKHDDDDDSGLPSSVSEYLSRLKRHNKELYKDPPVLPPGSIVIETEYVALPKRDATTGRLRFVPSPQQQKQKQSLFQDFRPNQTPAEVLQGGAFGGTYFRPISSAVTNRSYHPKDVLPTSVQDDWIAGLDAKTMLTSSTYCESVNKFKVKCGGSIGMWESSGWISNADPYGWFQWYCRFYQGRRCSDDERQIKRWLGIAGTKGRFKSQLCNKIIAACPRGTAIHDVSISPVIRQTLFHWGLLITKDVLEEHIKNRK